ncbi:hypothetical protein [Rhodanobacter sp. FW106-PBR-R2A-1-13]|uniref:hypothetical protein n=1 Tax=Rhodanobacter sp. FW106-PBR-R2A-1-13 TaxID=3454845 RepID=UPI0034E4149F
MKSSPSVVNIFTKEGDIKPYKVVAARVPEFLNRFPIEAGWRHIREVVEASSLTPHLAALHLAAVTGGKKPNELGLPELPQGLVFISRLLNPSGEEVASGSATSPALDLFAPGNEVRKDYEAAETAAYQRLLAAVGIGGEVFTEDETRTVARMGGRLDTSSPARTAGTTSQVDSASSSTRVVAQVSDADEALDHLSDGLPEVNDPLKALAGVGLDVAVRATEAQAVAQVDTGTVSPPDAGRTAVSTTPSAPAPLALVATGQANGRSAGRRPADKQILAAMNRQIAALSSQLGMKSAVAPTLDDARARMSELQALLTH